jgi:hypothetical protein
MDCRKLRGLMKGSALLAQVEFASTSAIGMALRPHPV